MQVSEAVRSRFSARAFLDRPVSHERIWSLLDRARWAPSGGNLQPWHVDAVAGRSLARLVDAVQRSALRHPRGEPPEYPVYPANLPEPYRSRRYACGEELYAAIGIPRDDKAARRNQFAQNLSGFGAPVVLFFSIERFMNSNQWAHLGMFMQNLMLLATGDGLHTCPQEAWSAFHETVADFLGLPPERMFYCGMALGHADLAHPINNWRTGRAPVETFARFHGLEPGAAGAAS